MSDRTATRPRRAARRLPRSLAGAVAATVTLSGLAPTISAPPALAAAAHVDRTAVADSGADWLARQIRANGGFLGSAKAPDLTDTAYAVVGLEAVGGHQRAAGEALGYLRRHVTALTTSDGSADPGAIADVILAGASAGADVRHFGGSMPVNDLPARLLATVRTSGSDRGLVGTADPTYNGAFRQGLALAALSTTTQATNRRVGLAISWLKRQQCTNGLWTAYRSDTRVPCPAADPATFQGPDTNSTSLAVQGLHAYGLTPRRSAVLSSLHAVQSADGGFPYLAAPGLGSDPNSTALTIQAILAEGGHPAGTAWQQGGATPYDALAAYQLGAGDPVADRGAFFFPDTNRTPSVLATVQAVPAAAARTLPVRH